MIRRRPIPIFIQILELLRQHLQLIIIARVRIAKTSNSKKILHIIRIIQTLTHSILVIINIPHTDTRSSVISISRRSMRSDIAIIVDIGYL